MAYSFRVLEDKLVGQQDNSHLEYSGGVSPGSEDKDKDKDKVGPNGQKNESLETGAPSPLFLWGYHPLGAFFQFASNIGSTRFDTLLRFHPLEGFKNYASAS